MNFSDKAIHEKRKSPFTKIIPQAGLDELDLAPIPSAVTSLIKSLTWIFIYKKFLTFQTNSLLNIHMLKAPN